jgi:predicted metalloprotease with PDZ domain
MAALIRGRMWMPLLATLLLCPPAILAQTPRPASSRAAVRLSVDAREATRGILHATLDFPAQPGPLTLLYPKWIPGNHAPTGPISELAGLRVSAADQPVTWKRDALDMYAFHLEVPSGSSSIRVSLDYLIPYGTAGSTWGASVTPNLLVLNWNAVVLYPKGVDISEIPYAAQLQLPPGWAHASALGASASAGNTLEFPAVSLYTLVDSPVIAGIHLRTVPLRQGTGPSEVLSIVADSSAALELKPEVVRNYERLMAETEALFGARHYQSYRFLLTLSDHVAGGGLEHHESSDNRLQERGLSDESQRRLRADLLPHELVHSWNGKYRRPEGLVQKDFHHDLTTELLWVYEGLTTYLGQVLAARSGLWSEQDFRENLAETAAYLDTRPGRTWLPLGEVAVASPVLRTTRAAYGTWRRSRGDIYDEAVLIWLEVDTLLRQRSQGRYSLDEFCRRFHGGQGGPPAVVPFSLGDITATLSEMVPYDWDGFFAERMQSTSPRAPMGGIEASGWRVTYSDTLPEMLKASEEANKYTELRYSLGVILAEGGAVRDVIPASPAAQAGIAPGMQLVAVNGRRYSPAVLRQVIKNSQDGSEPIELIVEDSEFYKTFAINYDGGERYPHLERDAARSDILAEILKPRTR